MWTLKVTAILACATAVLSGCVRNGNPVEASAAKKVRVGTYDSRAVAVAFSGSEIFSKWLGELKVEQERAEAAGDKARVAEIRAKGATRQKLMHMQGFSTAPVDDILDRVREGVQSVREKAGVDVLVSKWDKESLDRHRDAEVIDVTMDLVDLFNPNERQRRSALEIQKHDPISLKQAENIRD
ncbi:MAG TPA: hypothetical protein PLB62_15010 [Candidatus Sumerlaeota bacterium]|nr:hypothetical protein [Candidatus Sumerlaeota bacterium]